MKADGWGGREIRPSLTHSFIHSLLWLSFLRTLPLTHHLSRDYFSPSPPPTLSLSLSQYLVSLISLTLQPPHSLALSLSVSRPGRGLRLCQDVSTYSNPHDVCYLSVISISSSSSSLLLSSTTSPFVVVRPQRVRDQRRYSETSSETGELTAFSKKTKKTEEERRRKKK